LEEKEFNFEEGELGERVKELKEKLNIENKPPEPVEQQSYSEESPIKGSDINWDDYELDPSYAHLYPKAILKEIDNTVKWIAPLEEYFSISKAYSASGYYTGNDQERVGEPLNLGEYTSWMVNSRAGWQLVAFIPNGTGQAAIIFKRRVIMKLPDPVLIEHEAHVDNPTDQELKEAEEKSIEWSNKESTNVQS